MRKNLWRTITCVGVVILLGVGCLSDVGSEGARAPQEKRPCATSFDCPLGELCFAGTCGSDEAAP